MTRRARRAPVVEVNLACEKRFSNVWRARWQHFAGNGSGMGGRLRDGLRLGRGSRSGAGEQRGRANAEENEFS